MSSWDRVLFRAINGWPDSFQAVLVPFSVVQDTLAFRLAILAVVVAAMFRGGEFRRAAVLSLVAFPAADWLCTFLKNAFPYLRPYQELAGVVNRVGLSESPGTASSHAANLTAVATVMTICLGWRWGGPWVVVALFVCVSRVYVGAHYPWQVLLGCLVGLFAGCVSCGIARLLVRPRFVPQP